MTRRVSNRQFPARLPSNFRHYERHKARTRTQTERGKAILESMKLYMEYLSTQNCLFHRTQEEVDQDLRAFINHKKGQHLFYGSVPLASPIQNNIVIQTTS